MAKKWVYRVTLSPEDANRFIGAMVELDLIQSHQLKVIQEGDDQSEIGV